MIRLVVLLVLTCGAIVYLIPSFAPGLPDWWGRVLPTKGINLGLDLQGGTHLVLEVKVEKALENALDRVRDDLRLFFRERSIPVEEIEKTEGQVRFQVPSENAPEVRSGLRGEFPNLVLVRSSSAAGKTEFILALHERELRSLREDTVDQSLETIRNRIDQFGVREPTVQRQGSRDILIQLPGIQDPERAKDLIRKTALLEFKLLDEVNDVQEAVRAGPPPGREILYGYGSSPDEGLQRAEKIPYLLEARTLMTGDTITDGRVRPGDQLEGPYVELVFNSSGARLFERITGENVRRRLAIILDNRVYSAPVIQERISGGRASITGVFDFKEARDLAIVLRAGALPAPVKIIEERTVGPSLGRDSIRQGVISFIVGGCLLLIFMFVYYKGGGLLADCALVFNILFLLAILAGFQAVLTLPGIAGIILTLGMAVDANVLINERIREELRTGKSARAAVDSGYERALPAILDSNITTFLAGMTLFQFGTGPVKGFAVTLCAGILTSVLTAVYGTRIYYDLRMAARRLTRLSV